MGRRKRRRVDPTDDWEQLDLLCAWDGQREYERIRPQVLFVEPVPERSTQTGTSERVLYRKIAALREEGMESLLGSPRAKRRVLPPAIRRKIVDLKAEHPPLNLEEIANICGALFGRRPDGHTVKAVPGLHLRHGRGRPLGARGVDRGPRPRQPESTPASTTP